MEEKKGLALLSKSEQQESKENYSEEKNKLVEVIQVQESPFSLVRKRSYWVIVIGNQIASGEQFATEKEAQEYIDSKPWTLIVTACMIINNKLKNLI